MYSTSKKCGRQGGRKGGSEEGGEGLRERDPPVLLSPIHQAASKEREKKPRPDVQCRKEAMRGCDPKLSQTTLHHVIVRHLPREEGLLGDN